MRNVKIKNSKIFINLVLFFCLLILLFLMQFFLVSCQAKDIVSNLKLGNNNIKDNNIPTTKNENNIENIKDNTIENTTTKSQVNDEKKSSDLENLENFGNNNLNYFDYNKITIDTTTSIGVNIKNCNLVLDYFGNLNIYGEVENISSSSKTNVVLTFDFYNKNNELIFSDSQPIGVNYLRTSTKIPFNYIIKNSNMYIDIAKIKIGINYKDYYKLFLGNVVVRQQQFYYKNNILHIDGELINIGENSVDNIILLASFYDKLDKVVFIREGYLQKTNLEPQEQENFNLEVLLGKYTPNFTHYDFEVFFEDSIKMQ